MLKGLKGFFEQGQLDRRRFFVINPCGRGNGSVLQIRFAQETFFQKQLRTDEQGIAGKGGGTGIGRAACIGGDEGQNLPEGLFGFCKPIKKGICRLTEITHAECRRQGGRVQEDTAFSVCHRGSLLFQNQISNDIFIIIPCLQGKKAAAKQIFSFARRGMSRLCLRIVEFAVKTADRRCKRLTHG